MEDVKNLKSGLGIAAFILSIIGFFLGFILVGVLFDIIAIILGIIAIVSKNNKKGLAIAGVIISTIGIITVILFYVVLGAFGNDSKSDSQIDTSAIYESEKEGSVKEEPVKDTKLTLGSEIELKNFVIVFHESSVEKIDNQFADIDHAVVVRTSILNSTDETQNMLFDINTTCFTPKGTEAGDSSQIYMNDKYPSYWHDDLRAGAVLETYLVFDYTEDGEYIIEVNGFWEDPLEVYIDVKK